jgi:hypothetical protein
MKKKYFLFFILGSILIFNSCNRTPDLTKNEIYQILNEIIVDDSLRMYRICSKVDILPFTGDFVTEFNEYDKKFIQHQKIIFKDFKLEPNRLKWYSSRKKVFEFIQIDTICSKKSLYKISFPIISADRTKVLIEITEDCNCLLGGQGVKNLYVKQNGHWKRIKSYDRWISEKTIQNTSSQQLVIF